MKLNRLILLSLGVFMLMACKREGCTDQTADNYDKKAKNDDGSCVYNGLLPNNPNNPNNPNDPNNPNQTLPIHLTGTETSNRTIANISTNSNVVEYYIDGSWNIDAAVTIEPGVRIEMRSGARINVASNGSLNAAGTASNKINIYGAQNTNGYWNNIKFNSNNPNNKLVHCNISNGSNIYSSEPAMIVVENNAQITIQNSNFSKGSEFGLMTDGEDSKLPNFHSNNFSGFSKAPIRLASLSHTNFIDNSTTIASDNTIPLIYIYGVNVNSNTFVPRMNVPYSIRESIDFYNSHTEVEDGVEMRMAANTGMIVQSSASLEFAGTASSRCVVTGEQPSKGYWLNIVLDSNNPNNKFSYTDFSGGRNNYSSQPGFIFLDGTAYLDMDNCDISNSTSQAVQGDASITFNDNGGNSWSNCDGGGGLLP